MASASGHEPVVVGGDDDEPTRVGEGAQQTDDAFDLQVVEVGGRFVGEEHRWIVGEPASDGHALLLTARHVAGKVMRTIREVDGGEQLLGPFARLGLAPLGGAERHRTFSDALSAGRRLNAWNTTPTVWRRYWVSALPERPTTSVSTTVTLPDAGVRSPAITDSRVVLPQPLAPSSSTSWPAPASSERFEIGRTT